MHKYTFMRQKHCKLSSIKHLYCILWQSCEEQNGDHDQVGESVGLGRGVNFKSRW